MGGIPREFGFGLLTTELFVVIAFLFSIFPAAGVAIRICSLGGNSNCEMENPIGFGSRYLPNRKFIGRPRGSISLSHDEWHLGIVLVALVE